MADIAVNVGARVVGVTGVSGVGSVACVTGVACVAGVAGVADVSVWTVEPTVAAVDRIITLDDTTGIEVEVGVKLGAVVEVESVAVTVVSVVSVAPVVVVGIALFTTVVGIVWTVEVVLALCVVT